MDLSLDTIWITQHKLRKPEQIAGMVKYISDGGSWKSDAANPIVINEFPDGLKIIHNGHHRIVSMFLAGKESLISNEFKLTKFHYEDYLNPNISAGFFTPFDPRIEVRLSDFGSYYTEVKAKVRNRISDQEVVEFINLNRGRYAEPRSLETVADLVKVLELNYE